MKTKIFFALIFMTCQPTLAQTQARIWQSDLGQLELRDDPDTTGEETLLWMADGQSRVIRIDEVSGDNFSGSFLQSRTTGEKILDVTFNLILDESYQKTLPLLKDPQFRKAFRVAPESCPTLADGLLIFLDNENFDQSLHCLIPQ